MRLRRPATDWRSAFTLIELLVVISIIGLLVAMGVMVGNKVMHSQRVHATEATMHATMMAIDQFKAEDPLANIYDRKGERSFGPYPPYQVTDSGVANVLGGNATRSLSLRLQDDLRISSGGVKILDVSPDPDDPNRTNDDIRALYAYLAVYAAGTLNQVPEGVRKPLPLPNPFAFQEGEYLQTGSGGALDRTPVLGIYDQWGVPLDYFLYVKVEYTASMYGAGYSWRVTDRIPVLRSRGVAKDVADANGDTAEDWVFSSECPTPIARAVSDSGKVIGMDPEEGGWVRAVPAGDYDLDKFNFLPNGTN